MQERHSLSKTDKNHKMAGNLPAVSVEPGFYDQPRKSGDGGIRTLVPRRANAFRVRPVMTASIRLLVMNRKVYYNTLGTNVKITALNYNTNLLPKSI